MSGKLNTISSNGSISPCFRMDIRIFLIWHSFRRTQFSLRCGDGGKELRKEAKGERKVYTEVTKDEPMEAVDSIEQCLATTAASASLYAKHFPCFELVMSAYLVVIVSTAECERVFSKLKLIKTALRNRLSQSTLEQLNGPKTLEEFESSGIVKDSLTYYFSLKDRNVKPPPSYINMDLMRKLDKLSWKTTCKFPVPEAASTGVTRMSEKSAAAMDALKKDLDLSWPYEEDELEEELEEDDDLDGATGQSVEGLTGVTIPDRSFELTADSSRGNNNNNSTSSSSRSSSSSSSSRSSSSSMAMTDEEEEECENNGLSSANNQPKKKQKRKTYARGVDGLNDSLSHLYADPTQIAPTDAAGIAGNTN
jgi:hypothetical protein